MNDRSIRGIAILGAIFASSGVMAQTVPPTSKPELSARILETKLSEPNPAFPARIAERFPLERKPKFAARFSKTRFLLLSAAVYGASLADMHQTLEAKKKFWWYEANPLARPFVRLPAPAYYATGLAMATGVNWLSWKMAHSRRWRKLSPIPQMVAIIGNIHGFQTNRY